MGVDDMENVTFALRLFCAYGSKFEGGITSTIIHVAWPVIGTSDTSKLIEEYQGQGNSSDSVVTTGSISAWKTSKSHVHSVHSYHARVLAHGAL